MPGEYYLFNMSTCVYRGPPCNFDTHYESPLLSKPDGPRVCLPLSYCNTNVQPIRKSLAVNLAPVQVYQFTFSIAQSRHETELVFQVRYAYVTTFQTQWSDRSCWNFTACPTGSYALQALVDDDNGFLIKPLICKAYRQVVCELPHLCQVSG